MEKLPFNATLFRGYKFGHEYYFEVVEGKHVVKSQPVCFSITWWLQIYKMFLKYPLFLLFFTVEHGVASKEESSEQQKRFLLFWNANKMLEKSEKPHRLVIVFHGRTDSIVVSFQYTSWCDFLVYCKQEFHRERVYFDALFLKWDDNENWAYSKLDHFDEKI